jgi:signal transduction histidine kinase
MMRAVNVKPFRIGIRTRLTLLYGGMFLLAGGALIVIFYVIFTYRYPGGKAVADILAGSGNRRPHEVITFRSGARLTLPDVDAIRQKFDQHRAKVLAALVDQCLLALAAVTAIAVGFGWIMAGRALRPVRSITDTARRVVGRNLNERIALQGPDDELKELADTFDAMLERLDASFEGQRQFVANASHELRTPLATNRTLIEVALASDRVPPELRQLVDTILRTNSRSELIIDGLLTLARSESQAIRRLPVDLSDVAADAIEQTAHEAAAARVAVDATPDPAVTVGDPILLERLALNLVRNGIRHNYPDGWVTVSTGAVRAGAGPAGAGGEPGEVELVVANSGPLVPPQQVDMLFEPFRRLDSSRIADTDGVGLGLSIVRSVVQSHGGKLVAASRESGGLVIQVRLPAAPHDDLARNIEMVTRPREDFSEVAHNPPSGIARRIVINAGSVPRSWFRIVRKN